MPRGKNHSPEKSPLLLKLGLASFLLPTPCRATEKAVELRACSPCPRSRPQGQQMPTAGTSILPGRESPIRTGTSHESTPARCIPQGQGPGCLKREGILWLLSLHFRLQGPRCREGHLHKGLALRTTGWASPEGRGPPSWGWNWVPGDQREGG